MRLSNIFRKSLLCGTLLLLLSCKNNLIDRNQFSRAINYLEASSGRKLSSTEMICSNFIETNNILPVLEEIYRSGKEVSEDSLDWIITKPWNGDPESFAKKIVVFPEYCGVSELYNLFWIILRRL